jgi:hypothetical protein
MPDYEVNWYENDVRLAIQGASDDILDQAAFQAEGLAKVDAPVDTGFLRNAIYAISSRRSGRSQAWKSGSYSSQKDGRPVSRALAPEANVQTGEAALHAASEYTIYQEMALGFIYGAVEKVKRLMGGIISEVGRKRFG